MGNDMSESEQTKWEVLLKKKGFAIYENVGELWKLEF